MIERKKFIITVQDQVDQWVRDARLQIQRENVN